MAAFEAVFIGMLLLTSVAMLSAIRTSPPPSFSPDRAPMETTVSDLLEALHLLPGTLDAFDDAQEQVVGKAVIRNFTLLERLIQKTLPTGAGCRLWLDNGHDERILYGPQSRAARESVAASRLYHPSWAYALVLPSFDTVYQASPLDVTGYAVSQGALVKEAGVPVEVTLSTDAGTYARGTVLSVQPGPTAALWLRDQDGDLNLSYQDPLVPPTNTTLLSSDSQSGPLDASRSFVVPEGNANRLLWMAGRLGGTVAAQVVTVTDPLGIPTVYLLTSIGTYNHTIPVTSAGTWWVNATGTLVGDFLNPAYSEMNVTLVDTGYNADWQVVVAESANQPIPAGARLTARLPNAFKSVTQTNTTQAGWANISVTNSTDPQNGTLVTADLASPLQDANLGLTIHGVRDLTADSIYAIDVELSGSSGGAHATLLVDRPAGLLNLTNPIRRDLYLAAPKPMAPNQPATLGLVFAYPSTAAAGVPETLLSVDVRALDGTPLFASVSSGLGPGTWTVTDGGRGLRWVGSVAVAPNQLGVLAARVIVANLTTAYEPPHRLPVEFATGAEFPLANAARPYLFIGSFPPNGTDPGYQIPTLSGLPAQGQAKLGVEWFARANRVHGNATYNVTSFPPLQLLQEALRLGLARSHVNLSTERVPIGESFNVRVDLEGLMQQVNVTAAAQAASLAVSGWAVTVSVYDPAQPLSDPADWEPSFRGTFGGASPGISQAPLDLPKDAQWNPEASGTTAFGWAVANLTFKPPVGAFYGPHLITAEAKFLLSDPVGGQSIIETARKVAVVDVVPDLGQSDTALYWLSLECWMPDW